MSKKAEGSLEPQSLSELLAYMASHKPVEAGINSAQTHPKGTDPASSSTATDQKTAQREPAQLDYFRDLWAGVNANLQLKQSQERVPGNAGPLNSSNLVYRSLMLMRDLSPGYLQHFLAHVEALSWMEQLSDSPAPSGQPKEAARRGSARKSARSR